MLKKEWDGRKVIRNVKEGNQQHMVRFQVLTATSMKMAAFWDVATSGRCLPTFQR
jgi:hypothetical protein